VIDGGSWKEGFEKVLPLANYLICSERFLPPGCCRSEDVVQFATEHGVAHGAITRGADPLFYWSSKLKGELVPPSVNAVDTLGAGDFFHGAFCHAILRMPFIDSLTFASRIASQSCKTFGTRRWMNGINASGTSEGEVHRSS